MGAGRFVLMSVPFALTFASLVCISIVYTGQNPNKDYFFAKFNTANITVTESQLVSRDTGIAHLHTEALASSSSSDSSSSTSDSTPGIAHLHTEALSASSSSTPDAAVNAQTLGLADFYTVGLWGYCNQTNSSGKITQKCSSPKAEFWFDPFELWNLNDTSAENAINSTVLNDALKSYKKASKWTFVLYTIALIFTALEILFGVVAIFSKIGSCITYIVSAVSSVAIIAASLLATIMWSIVVASFNKELKKYGLTADISTKMLSVTWLAVAFSLASGFFWLISVCCCGSTERHHSRNRGGDAEKFNGPYQQVQEHNPAFVSAPYAGAPSVYNPPTQQGFGNQEYGPASAKPIRDLDTAYEPYRHGNV